MDPDQGVSKKEIQDEINSLSKLLIDIGYDITKIQTDTSLTDQERRDKLRVARQAEESVSQQLGEKQLQLTFFKKN